MPKLLFLLLLSGIAMPALAARRVTVDELEKTLAAVHGRPDANVAQQLLELELTERLSAARLSRAEAGLPGVQSRQALVLLADTSAFLDPPAAEIPATATPDLAAQRRLMTLTVDYVGKTIHQLPNFFATRDTIRFEDSPKGYRADMSAIPYEPLHAIGRSTDTVLYRNGEEVVDSAAAKGKKPEQSREELTTTGVFGPILGTVLVDAARSKLVWSHWELGASGPEAVFHYAVPAEKSHYQVQYCCFEDGSVFRQFSGYHGEIAVDPVSGAILRLTLQADLKSSDPLLRSDILVEYGPVEIGGRSYICPVKNVSVLLAPVKPETATDIPHNRNVTAKGEAAPDSPRMLLNDVVFDQYHQFRANARIVVANNGNANNGETGGSLPVSGETDAASAGGASAEAGTADRSAAAAEPVAASGDAAPVPAASGTSVSAAEAEGSGTTVVSTMDSSESPEMSVADAANLPEDAAIPRPALQTGFTLRVATRLVDLDVVAYDKKGHRVMGLKPEDFEVYDNGRRQEVRFFGQADGAPAEDAARAPGEPAFSNRSTAVADVKTGTSAAEGNMTVLLIDAGNLAGTDLTRARAEMLHCLQTLPAEQRVALYVMKAQGFQVLDEGSVDHALVASKLREWTPGAQDLARAQEMEQRDRQPFDEAPAQADLQNGNGNNGGSSGREGLALPILANVARHLGAIPGHKNLVWVTGDNALTGWADKAVSSDKGGRHIEGFVLQAQEALNDAHVSVYPLDASQLETQAIDPALNNPGIDSSPSGMGAPRPPGGGQQGGQIQTGMQQDLHPIQTAIQDMATATGGRAFPRSGDIAAELNGVVADGRATYLLGFTPDAAADDKYHQLTVKLAGRRGVTLRYRTGYLYAKEPASLKDRFRQAMWQPLDISEIAVSADPMAASTGAALRLNVAANDLALKQVGELWVDQLDFFVIQRDDDGTHARIHGQTLRLTLKPATYEKMLQEGIPFSQPVDKLQGTESVRIIVVDENSGRMGSVTVPAAALNGKS
jgi:VWFA-related protein